MNAKLPFYGDVEIYIRQKCPWSKLPQSIKQILGESPKEYEKLIVKFSIKNQLRYRVNLVKNVKKDERAYYEELVTYSREHLMLYPYHLSDFIVTGMRITPFQYYIAMMQDLMEQEKSYDSLPNFTATDCLRLLGIGRNQYIELMNQCRSSKKFFGVRRKPIRELLPQKPVSSIIIEPWWKICVGYVTEDDIKIISVNEKEIIDKVIDHGPQKAGDLNAKDVKDLYRRGLVYLDVPIDDEDYVCVPPLEGFVMNRVLGDYLEILLYKIFVSIDEHTTISELANVLQVELELVKNAVSMYCRLGFAKKKCQEDISNLHPSWEKHFSSKINEDSDDYLMKSFENGNLNSDIFSISESVDQVPSTIFVQRRIGFLFDSTLTAFLMMGNLSPGLKSHAVTMFEVGKLTDESLDSFLVELSKVDDVGEGEARRYFDHALSLRDTIIFLRHNNELMHNLNETNPSGLGLDLLRCESLQNLDHETCSRLLNKNYSLLISMAPLTNEIRTVSSCSPPHLGPPIAEVSSVWFKLYLYSITKSGPPSLLLTKGTRLRKLPSVFKDHEKLFVTTWAHDPSTVLMSNALPILNDALCHSAVLVQGQGNFAEFHYVPFPLQDDYAVSTDAHVSIKELAKQVDLAHNCGYITMIKTMNEQKNSFIHLNSKKEYSTITNVKLKSKSFDNIWIDNDSLELNQEEIEGDISAGAGDTEKIVFIQEQVNPNLVSLSSAEKDWMILDCSFGIPLFNGHLNKQVCKRIRSMKLCHSFSLKNHIASNRKLSLQILQFISNNQPVITSHDIGRSSSFLPIRSGSDTEIPLPSNNLFYYNGQLTVWEQ